MRICSLFPVAYSTEGRTRKWFAIRVRSNCEIVTATALQNRSYEEFLPVYRCRRRWSDRWKEIERPLFPGYVFARLDPQELSPVLSLPGVVHIVGIGRIPVPVEDFEIAAIQAVVSSRLAAEPWPFMRCGQRVVIEEGPLAGIEGLLVQVKKHYRLVVSVTLLQRSLAVEVNGEWVRPLLSGAAACGRQS